MIVHLEYIDRLTQHIVSKNLSSKTLKALKLNQFLIH